MNDGERKIYSVILWLRRPLSARRLRALSKSLGAIQLAMPENNQWTLTQSRPSYNPYTLKTWRSPASKKRRPQK